MTRKPKSLGIRVAVTALSAGLTLVSACSSGGVSHTVPEAAIVRVTGPDKAKIDAARAQVAAAQQQLKASKGEEKQAEAAIAQAEREVKQAEKQVEKAQRQLEIAETKKQLREAELELAQLNQEVKKQEVYLALAKYELAKYEAVGRVEAGSEPGFQQGLANFQRQVAEKQVDLSHAREDAAKKAAEIRDLKRSIGES